MASAVAQVQQKQALQKMTADEFLEWDGDAHQGKLELVHGEILAMSPASATHGIIQAKVARLIGNHLDKSSSACRVGTETPVQPRMGAESNIRVPDLAVTCLPASGKEKLFPDPVLIIEILSPGNERDTWAAIHACLTIPTIAEVLVLDSEKVEAQVFTKDDAGAWPVNGVTSGAGGTVNLHSIDAQFGVNEIYADTYLLKEDK